MSLCGTDGQTNDEQLKIELLSQWKLEAEFRNYFEYRRYYCFLIVLPERQFSVKMHDCVTVSHPVPSFPFISIFECGTRQIEEVLGLIPKHM